MDFSAALAHLGGLDCLVNNAGIAGPTGKVDAIAPEELGPDNIRVNALLPGIVAGERQRRVLGAKVVARGVSFEQVEKAAFAGTSIKQYVTPEQLADYAVYLASPRAKTISGQALSVCGDTNILS
jgi:NAD(P)-dependent dehydrogenase (short-subunit alcohol dehydrogenase family)